MIDESVLFGIYKTSYKSNIRKNQSYLSACKHFRNERKLYPQDKDELESLDPNIWPLKAICQEIDEEDSK